MRSIKRKSVLFISIVLMLLLSSCASKNEESYLDLGMSSIEGLEFQQALEYFDVGLENEKEKDLNLIYRGKGLAYMGLSEYELAIVEFRNALDLSYTTPQAVDYDMNYYIAICYYKLGMLPEALERYDAILALKPKDVDAYFLRGTIYSEQGNLSDDLVDYDKALSIDKNNHTLAIDTYLA